MSRRLPLSIALIAMGSGFAEAQPTNDACNKATLIASLPFSDTVDASTATIALSDPGLDCGEPSGPVRGNSVWYRYEATVAINLDVSTFGSDYDNVLAAYLGGCGELTEIACSEYDENENRPPGPADRDDARFVVTLQAGQEVWILVADEEDAGAGTLVINVTETPVFQANRTVQDADRPAVAAGPGGDFLVVWEKDYGGLQARLVDADGHPRGSDFEVTPTDTLFPAAAQAGSGGFVVVWPDDDAPGMRARRLDASGTAIGSEIAVSTLSGDYPAVAADAAGNFVVVWEGNGVTGRRFDASGAPLAPEFSVTTGSARWPVVARDANGFVVAWEGEDDDSYGVFARRYDAAGAAQGGVFQVNAHTTGSQGENGPGVAMGADGGFVVVWQDRDEPSHPSYYSIVAARRFDASGVPQGSDFQVSNGTSPGYYSGQYGDDRNDEPEIAADRDGNFVVAWYREYSGPYARRLDADGTPVGNSFQVGTIWSGYTYEIDLAKAPNGDFMVVWERFFECCDNNHTFGRGFRGGSCPSTPDDTCKEPTIELKSRLSAQDKVDDRADGITWKWVKGEATTTNEIGDPLVADDYRLCVYDGSSVLLADITVDTGGTCGVNPCWRALGTPPGAGGFKYINKAGNLDGARKLVLLPGADGSAKAIVKAKGAGLDLVGPPWTLPVTAQLHSSTGTCWSAEFDGAGVSQNVSGVFSAKATPASP